MNQQFKVTGTKDTYIIFDKVLGKGAYGVVFYAESVK
jgi:MAP/microtubule affinity-regulating kinase